MNIQSTPALSSHLPPLRLVFLRRDVFPALTTDKTRLPRANIHRRAHFVIVFAFLAVPSFARLLHSPVATRVEVLGGRIKHPIMNPLGTLQKNLVFYDQR